MSGGLDTRPTATTPDVETLTKWAWEGRIRIPHFQRPLIGIRAMRSAGLRVEIDFAADTISVWTP